MILSGARNTYSAVKVKQIKNKNKIKNKIESKTKTNTKIK